MRMSSLALVAAVAGTLAAAACSKAELSYAKAVQPVFDKHCTACHKPGGEGFEKSGFATTSYDNVMKGNRFGPVVVAGHSPSSTLMILLEGKADPSINMPHGKQKIPEADIKVVKGWVDQGAKNN